MSAESEDQRSTTPWFPRVQGSEKHSYPMVLPWFPLWVLAQLVTAPRGRVADKRSSSRFSNDLGNRGKVPQVLGTSQEGIEFKTEFSQLRNRCRSKR